MAGALADRLAALKKVVPRTAAAVDHPAGRALTAKALAAAEKTHGIRLPEDYAGFLRTVANGGPAPDGQLFTLAQALAYETPRFDLPFPFSAADARRVVAAHLAGRREFLAPEDSVGGALPVSAGGDGDTTYLVVAGPLAGTVWYAGDPGWLPRHGPDGRLLGFLDWYELELAELGEVRAAAPRKRKPAAPPPIALDAYQLNLRDQGLEALPDEVARMTKVAMVWLGGNRLRAVPPALARLPTVFTLELARNPIETLDEAVLAALPRLSTLDLTGLPLRALPEVLTRLPLADLRLDRMPRLDLAEALALLARIPTLRRLSLFDCQLDAVPPGVLALTGLTHLYLNDNRIAELPPELARLDKLEVLGVMNNRIERVPDVLVGSVRNLYFGGNPGAAREKKRLEALRKGFLQLG